MLGKRFFTAIWDLFICFCVFFLSFILCGIIGAMTYGFICPGAEQVPEPWSTRIVYLSFIAGIVCAVVTWRKKRCKRKLQAIADPVKDRNPIAKVHHTTHPSALTYRPEERKISPRNDEIVTELQRIDFMEGHEFEYWCASLLRKIGFVNVEVTQGSGDQGVDVLAEKGGIRYAIQCKCYSKDLGNKPVQEVNSGKQMPGYHCQIGAVLTNRYFTKGAKELAAATGTLLWDRDWIEAQLRGIAATSSRISAEQSFTFHNDRLVEKAIDIFMDAGYVSALILKQKMGISLDEAHQVIAALEEQEIVSPANEGCPRQLLVSEELWNIYKQTHL